MSIEPQSRQWADAMDAASRAEKPGRASSGLLEGTMIETPMGALFVEHLTAGDVILAANDKTFRVSQVRRRKIKNVNWLPDRLRPVRIGRGALGYNTPHADLVVGGDHVIIVMGRPVKALDLVNGRSINFVPLSEMPTAFTYLQIETTENKIFSAEGVASASVDYRPIPKQKPLSKVSSQTQYRPATLSPDQVSNAARALPEQFVPPHIARGMFGIRP